MKILFRADSSSAIGIGHIMRDLVLAKQYPNDTIIFATQKLEGNINHKINEANYQIEILNTTHFDEFDSLIRKLNIDMIVIDHYGIDDNFEKKLKTQNSKLKLMVLDDTYEKHYCDILLNHNIYAVATRYKGLVPSQCELRCGERYTLLRDEFRKVKKDNKIINTSKVKNIFIAMGGTDIQNLNPKILKILETFKDIHVNIVTTNANPHLEELELYINDKEWITLHINSQELAKLMAKSDLAIITPSVTMNEVWYMELPFVAIQVTDNQQYMYEFLKNNNKAVLHSWEEQHFIEYLTFFLQSKNELTNFIDLSVEQKKRVLEWRNHPDVRKWMYHKELIGLEDHLNYIDSLKTKSDRVYFLVKQSDEEIGVIDLTSIGTDNESAEIGLYAKPSMKGVGNVLMQNILNYGFNTLKLETLKSNVYITNENAVRLYKKFGFIETKKDSEFIYMELTNENR